MNDIVIIGHIDDLAELPEADIGTSVTMLEPDKVTNQTIEDLTVMYLKDDKPGLYIILPSVTDTDEQLKDLITTIEVLISVLK